MPFCTTCGTLLQLRKTEFGKWMACPHNHPQPELNQERQVLHEKNTAPGKKIEVMPEENILAVHDHPCQRCGYGKAELIEMSCSYSDEDNYYRMKCGKCGHVEQLEGKVK